MYISKMHTRTDYKCKVYADITKLHARVKWAFHRNYTMIDMASSTGSCFEILEAWRQPNLNNQSGSRLQLVGNQ